MCTGIANYFSFPSAIFNKPARWNFNFSITKIKANNIIKFFFHVFKLLFIYLCILEVVTGVTNLFMVEQFAFSNLYNNITIFFNSGVFYSHFFLFISYIFIFYINFMTFRMLWVNVSYYKFIL